MTNKELREKEEEHSVLQSHLAQEKLLYEQHKADAEASKDYEYEVTEDKIIKKVLEPGVFVTNCLVCNRTCHYPCYINQDHKRLDKCPAMKNGHCTVCPQKCHWQQHRNMSFRLEVERVNVRKTFDDMRDRHLKSLAKTRDQLRIITDLEKEIVAKEAIIHQCNLYLNIKNE